MIRLALFSLAVLFFPPQDIINPCDLATVRKENWCAKCKRWKTKKEVGFKSKCKTCEEKVERIEACVKTYYVCTRCQKTSKSGGTCGTVTCSRQKRVEQRSVARTLYKCTGTCKRTADESRKCTKEDCSKKNGRYKKTCEYSGHYPHQKKK